MTCAHKHVNWLKHVTGDGYFGVCAECNAIITDKPKSVLVLSGSHHEFYQYRFHQCEKESQKRKHHVWVDSDFGKQFVDGSQGMFHGLHFDTVVVTGTFHEQLDAKNIMAYAKTVLNPGGTLIDETQVLPAMMTKPEGVVKPKPLMFPLTKPFLLPKKDEPSQPLFNGEVRKLPKANSPLWTMQWAAQGSAKAPYIVSQRPMSQSNGAITSEGWACSCRDFTAVTRRVRTASIFVG